MHATWTGTYACSHVLVSVHASKQEKLKKMFLKAIKHLLVTKIHIGTLVNQTSIKGMQRMLILKFNPTPPVLNAQNAWGKDYSLSRAKQAQLCKCIVLMNFKCLHWRERIFSSLYMNEQLNRLFSPLNEWHLTQGHMISFAFNPTIFFISFKHHKMLFLGSNKCT